MENTIGKTDGKTAETNVDGRGKSPGSRRTQFGAKEVIRREKAEDPWVESDASLYDDMLHVRRRPKSEDRTEGQRDCRRWKRDDLRGFLMKFADLEKAHLQARKGSGEQKNSPEPEETVDEGTEQARAIIRSILRGEQ